MDEDNKQTAGGESLDEVLSTIRNRVQEQMQRTTNPAPQPQAAPHPPQAPPAVQPLEESAPSQATITAQKLEEIILATAKPLLEFLLKQWVENNLPALAEKLIRDEIEKRNR